MLRPLVCSLLLFAGAACADGIDDLIGTWISPDGFAKNDYVRGLDGDWISTHMWFRVGDDWELVSQGAMYQRPGDDAWISISRARDMGNIELFESVFRFHEGGIVTLRNTAYTRDGEQVLSEEEWQVDGDAIRYQIFEIVDGARQPMMTGEWKKLTD